MSSTLPPDGRRNLVYDEIHDELRANPGEWQLVAEARPGSASEVVRRALTLRGGVFETTTRYSRRGEKGRRVVDIYARFLGEGQ